jgi:hypothetical protein
MATSSWRSHGEQSSGYNARDRILDRIGSLRRDLGQLFSAMDLDRLGLAVLFFVVPLTAILWFMALLDRFAKFNVSRQHFAVVGTVVPALYAWCLMVRST